MSRHVSLAGDDGEGTDWIHAPWPVIAAVDVRGMIREPAWDPLRLVATGPDGWPRGGLGAASATLDPGRSLSWLVVDHDGARLVGQEPAPLAIPVARPPRPRASRASAIIEVSIGLAPPTLSTPAGPAGRRRLALLAVDIAAVDGHPLGDLSFAERRIARSEAIGRIAERGIGMPLIDPAAPPSWAAGVLLSLNTVSGSASHLAGARFLVPPDVTVLP